MCDMKCDECTLRPATIAAQGCYNPAWSERALKPPIFVTSTFVVETAEELAADFVKLYGLDGKGARKADGLVYTRADNPNFGIFEDRVRHMEGAEGAVLTSSGMSAICTTLIALTELGDTIMFGAPVYGGTDFVLNNTMPRLGRKVISFVTTEPTENVQAMIKRHGPRVIFLESPGNPTAQLADIRGISKAAHEIDPSIIVVADNTIATFIHQNVLEAGADLSLYSLTKMIGGHDDLIGGLVMGRKDLTSQIETHRTLLGTMSSPHNAWMLTRSLETLVLRAHKSQDTAQRIAADLQGHPAIEDILYPGFFQSGEQQRRFESHCSGQGSFMSIRVRGGQAEAFRVLNALTIFKIGVSMGGNISLASHPKTHSHSDVSPEHQELFGITDNLIRLSMGLEDIQDLWADLNQALNTIL